MKILARIYFTISQIFSKLQNKPELQRDDLNETLRRLHEKQ